MSALLTIDTPLRGLMITVRFDVSKRHSGVDVTPKIAERVGCHFDVREVELGELESVVISAIKTEPELAQCALCGKIIEDPPGCPCWDEQDVLGPSQHALNARARGQPWCVVCDNLGGPHTKEECPYVAEILPDGTAREVAGSTAIEDWVERRKLEVKSELEQLNRFRPPGGCIIKKQTMNSREFKGDGYWITFHPDAEYKDNITIIFDGRGGADSLNFSYAELMQIIRDVQGLVFNDNCV